MMPSHKEPDFPSPGVRVTLGLVEWVSATRVIRAVRYDCAARAWRV